MTSSNGRHILVHLPSRQSASAHCQSGHQALDEYEWSVLEHLRYFPDLAPCDYWLFPKMKEPLRGHRFELEKNIIIESEEAIRELDKDTYITAFDSCLRRMQKSIDNGGCYVE
ncbi:histone-lysine N-methyltransferase SETMAR [Plakobranchus ocellatus]|uniref:Histone-lysine N-methyltransferase SETMAR n=1 Tax=Plakobranchus ocellatus TaxID=259542 RepID=A0AAV4AA73_9GAST|nr:histone-lysine N-methyltransferase SETMAR [Plakobranchus ocellatus]